MAVYLSHAVEVSDIRLRVGPRPSVDSDEAWITVYAEELTEVAADTLDEVIVGSIERLWGPRSADKAAD